MNLSIVLSCIKVHLYFFYFCACNKMSQTGWFLAISIIKQLIDQLYKIKCVYCLPGGLNYGLGAACNVQLLLDCLIPVGF